MLYCFQGGHLLISITLCYVTGIMLFRLFPVPAPLSLILIIALSAACLLFYVCRFRLLTLIFLALTFFMFGSVSADRTSLAILSPHHIVRHIDVPQETVILGTLCTKVSEKIDLSRAHIDVSFVRTNINGPFKPVEGQVLLTLKGSWPDHIKPGDGLLVRTTLRLPSVNNTPGTFNYREYLARKGIFLTGLVSHPILVRPADRIAASFHKRFFYRIERLRTNISAFIDANLQKRTAAIYQALIIGDRTEIFPEDLETFMRAGIMHLLAISGMHIGLVAALLYFVINWILRRSQYLILHLNVRKTTLLLLLPALFFYMLLTGANPPVVRSFVMITVFILAFGMDRFHAPLIPLATAVFLILLFDPAAAFSASFQLSVVAVASILMITPKIISHVGIAHASLAERGAICRLIWLFLTIGIVTVVATIGTFPLMLYHFNRISLVSLPANLLIQPIIGFWSLPVAILSIACSVLSGEAAGFLLKAGAYGIDASLEIGKFLSSHEHMQLWLPGPSIAACILYYCGLMIMGANVQGRAAVSAGTALLTISLSIFLLPISNLPSYRKDISSVSILDVGHGSAGVIEMSNGHIILIDGGARSAPGYDCGDRVISPFLWHRKIGRIDDIVITHDDADHYNGISTIIKRFRPNRLFLPYVEFPKKGLQQITACAREHDVELVVPEQDTVISQDRENLLIFLAESREHAEDKPTRNVSEDDRGLLLKFVSGGYSVLFPGDITSAKEHELAGRLEQIESTVLLSPHHGSSSSNSYSFLQKVNPVYLIFSADDHGNGLFPSSIALENAESLHINTLTTSTDGSVLITFTHGSGYRIDTFKQSDQQFFRNG